MKCNAICHYHKMNSTIRKINNVKVNNVIMSFFKSVPRATTTTIAPGNVLLLYSEKIVNQCANVQMLNATLLVDVISDQKKIQKLVWVFFWSSKSSY